MSWLSATSFVGFPIMSSHSLFEASPPLSAIDSQPLSKFNVKYCCDWLRWDGLSFRRSKLTVSTSTVDATTMMTTDKEELSKDEIALYDRQLRLWGVEAQNRMRKARVLLVTIKALGNEIAKNLVLAGIGSLTIVDPDTVTQADVASQFFVTKENIGQNVNSAG